MIYASTRLHEGSGTSSAKVFVEAVTPEDGEGAILLFHDGGDGIGAVAGNADPGGLSALLVSAPRKGDAGTPDR